MSHSIEYDNLLPPEATALTMEEYAKQYRWHGTYTFGHNGTSDSEQQIVFPALTPYSGEDLKTGAFDEILLAHAKLPTEQESQRLRLLEQVGKSVLELDGAGKRNEHRVGRFLNACTTIFTDKETAPSLKEAVSLLVSPQQFDELLAEGAKSTWKMENTEALFHAYVRLQTAERVYGKEEAHRLKREIIQKAISARELDRVGDMAAWDETMESEPRRTVIHLGHAGHELPQVAEQVIAEHEAAQLNMHPRYVVYYRNGALVIGEIQKGYMSKRMALAEKRRRGGEEPPRLAGTDLPTFGGTVDEDEVPKIMIGKANVGAHLIVAAGWAAAFQQDAILKSGLMYDHPKRNDAYRMLDPEEPTDIVFCHTGEGGLQNFNAAVLYARLFRAGFVPIVELNFQSIGTEAEEIRAQEELWKLGHGEGMAMVEFAENDLDGVILFYRGAMGWRRNNGEPIGGIFKVQRLVAHSSHHGDNRMPDIVGDAVTVLEKEMAHYEEQINDDNIVQTLRDFHRRESSLPETDRTRTTVSDRLQEFFAEKRDLNPYIVTQLLADVPSFEHWLALKSFHDHALFRSERFDYPPVIRDRLREFVNDKGDPLQPANRQNLLDIAARVHDPLEEVIAMLAADGILTKEETAIWHQESYDECKAIDDQVRELPLPDPKEADRHFRYPTPYIIVKGSEKDLARTNKNDNHVADIETPWSNREITMNGAEAHREVLVRVHEENPRFTTASVDGNKGERIERVQDREKNRVFYQRHQVGGYFKELDGVWAAVGHRPGAFWNLPINERATADFFFGYTYQPTSRVAHDLALQQMLLHGEIQPGDPRLMQLMRRAYIDGAYADYQSQMMSEGPFIHASVVQASGGKFTSPVIFSLPEGIVDGGGFMHCNQVEGSMNQAPGFHVYTVSRPHLIHDLMNYQLRFQYNPSGIAIARSAYLTKETWTEGTGFFEAGRDFLVKEGNDALAISWSSMMPKIEAAVGEVEKRMPGASVRVLEKVSWTDCTGDDMEDALAKTSGPIFIATEEFRGRSIGNNLVTDLVTSDRFKPLTIGRGRDIHFIAMKGNAHPPCDIRLVNALRLSPDELTTYIGKALVNEKNRQYNAQGLGEDGMYI